MENMGVYEDIKARTDGDIYVGVVGPVRTGKSTFIKNFMDLLVIPNIENSYKRERARDELPQSAAGRTIMTTEPKFVPNEAIEITIGDNLELKTRLVDCVGYLVNNALGYMEEDVPRMVKTPWSDEEIPFEEAAEIGTRKVIQEHSTIGILVTTDGSITEIPREDYVEAESRVVNELKELNKPFVIVLNTNNPSSDETRSLANELEEKYGVSVIPTDCTNLNNEDINNIFGKILYEFPIERININFPSWIDGLDNDNELRQELFKEINAFVHPEKAIILFDEIDALALDRTNSNDLREMGRATSTLLKCLDRLNENIVLVATTNLFEWFDKALSRRFDFIIDFNRYTEEDLMDISEKMLNAYLDKMKLGGRDIRLFRKIMRLANPIPYPGELKNLLKTSIAFSDVNDGMDYFRRIYYSVCGDKPEYLARLQEQGFTVREIEILTKKSKSSVSRELKAGVTK